MPHAAIYYTPCPDHRPGCRLGSSLSTQLLLCTNGMPQCMRVAGWYTQCVPGSPSVLFCTAPAPFQCCTRPLLNTRVILQRRQTERRLPPIAPRWSADTLQLSMDVLTTCTSPYPSHTYARAAAAACRSAPATFQGCAAPQHTQGDRSGMADARVSPALQARQHIG